MLQAAERSQCEEYGDDVSGRTLSPYLVVVARRDELDEFRTHGVDGKVPIQRCWEGSRQDPINGVRLVDASDGDDLHMEVRSRLDATMKTGESMQLFVATTPIEL